MNFTCAAGPFKNMIFVTNVCLSLFLSYPSEQNSTVCKYVFLMEDGIYREDVSLARFCGLIPSYISSI